MDYQKYLPIGTVVMLKGGKKRAMITGFCAVSGEHKDRTFDYSGCLYPEGFLSSNQTLLFNHEQIDKIYYLGFVDDEEKTFKERLNKMMEDISKKDQETDVI